MIRTLVVDDERIARDGLRLLLGTEGRCAVVGEATNGRDALAKIRALAPQLVFLDVRMPELDGFAVLRALRPDERPIVVFVTAYDRFALQAFEANAVDYLLKPFDRDRLRRAIDRAERFLGSDGPRQERVTALLRQLDVCLRDVTAEPAPRAGRIPVRDRGSVTFIEPDDVVWAESDGNYLHVCARTRTGVRDTSANTRVHLLRETLRAFERRLDPRRFLRVSRSALVNVEEVVELRRGADGVYVLVMRSGHRLRSSRRYRGRLSSLVAQGA